MVADMVGQSPPYVIAVAKPGNIDRCSELLRRIFGGFAGEETLDASHPAHIQSGMHIDLASHDDLTPTIGFDGGRLTDWRGRDHQVGRRDEGGQGLVHLLDGGTESHADEQGVW